MKKAFVTVGTTEFDALIREAASDAFCNILREKNFEQLILQIGRGSFEPVKRQDLKFSLDYFRYKDSISDDIANADLVISHAGAGSVLETLEAGRNLVVVINEELMDNHQTELAQQLHKCEFLYYSNVRNLCKTIKNADFTQLKPYKKGQPDSFAKALDKIMGFS